MFFMLEIAGNGKEKKKKKQKSDSCCFEVNIMISTSVLATVPVTALLTWVERLKHWLTTLISEKKKIQPFINAPNCKVCIERRRLGLPLNNVKQIK